MKILVLNGPNLNFLGIREKGIYGTEDYHALVSMLEEKRREKVMSWKSFRVIMKVESSIKFRRHITMEQKIIINPGAFTHYSYAVRDALGSVEIPKVEVHISNVHKREEFRHTSVTAPVCTGQVVGLGLKGYALAMDYLTGK